MELIRLATTDSENPSMDGLFGIYSQSINAIEQKPRWLLNEMLQNPNYYFYIANVEEKIVGFAIVYSPENSDYCLLEYIAIDSNLRNNGLGGKIFDILTDIFSTRTMVLEIDSPYEDSEDNTMRLKRLEFYKRHGSGVVEGLKYILPFEADHIPEMLVLLHSNIYTISIPKEKITAWLTDIYISVYGCAAEDKRLYTMVCNLPDNISILY